MRTRRQEGLVQKSQSFGGVVSLGGALCVFFALRLLNDPPLGWICICVFLAGMGAGLIVIGQVIAREGEFAQVPDEVIEASHERFSPPPTTQRRTGENVVPRREEIE